jgi:hypothetical protein
MNYVGAWTQAVDGNLYYWNFCGDPVHGKCDQPIVSSNTFTSIPDDTHKDDRYTVMEKDRPCTGLPGKIIDCAFGFLPGGGPSIGTIYFAVLDDGSLWALRSLPGWGDDQGLFLIFGPPIGLVLGAIAGALFLARQYRRNV